MTLHLRRAACSSSSHLPSYLGEESGVYRISLLKWTGLWVWIFLFFFFFLVVFQPSGYQGSLIACCLQTSFAFSGSFPHSVVVQSDCWQSGAADPKASLCVVGKHSFYLWVNIPGPLYLERKILPQFLSVLLKLELTRDAPYPPESAHTPGSAAPAFAVILSAHAASCMQTFDHGWGQHLLCGLSSGLCSHKVQGSYSKHSSYHLLCGRGFLSDLRI